MRLFFTNAIYDPQRYEGSRIHIEQLVSNLSVLGHEIWGPNDSPSHSLLKVSSCPVVRFNQLRKMDVFYLRVEGRPLSTPFFMREPWWSLSFQKPVIWELNAASDLVYLAKSRHSSTILQTVDAELSGWAKRVTLAICNTDGLARYAKDLGISNTVTIPLGSDPRLFSNDVTPISDISQRSGCINVVWCGNTKVPWHDFETIIAAARLLKNNDKIRFYIIGEFPTGLRFPDNMIFLGQRPYEEMPRYLNAMDVGLAIYKPATWSRYGVFSSPLKLFDYLAVGLIIVASPIEQVKKCIGHRRNGFIVPFGNPDDLAKYLIEIANRKNELANMHSKARRMVIEYYNWHRVAQETVEVISSVL